MRHQLKLDSDSNKEALELGVPRATASPEYYQTYKGRA